MTDKSFYHYSAFVEDVTSIKNTIVNNKNDWFPDLIVGLSRGGLVPAVALSHALDIPLRTIEWSKSKQRVNQDICELVSAQTHNILIVDDIVDTGELLSQLFEDWDKWATFDNSYVDASKIRVASLVNYKPAHVLYDNLSGSITCNYYARTYKDKPWIDFFWETI